ncbi:MAG TPA: delta-60 repeat domain-containing protein [Herpetosiphonaceae bacterium]
MDRCINRGLLVVIIAALLISTTGSRTVHAAVVVVDPTFNPGSGANDRVLALALQPDGKVLLGGMFTSVGGTARTRIARLNADGTLDTSFNPGSGANSAVWALALQPDGKVLLGGDFWAINGTGRNGIARLNADGTLDTSFNPNPGVDSYVYALALQPDGKVLLGGMFTSVGGTARNSIARLNTDGTLDTSFNPGSGVDSYVHALALQPDGKVLLGGSFSSVGGTARTRIARLNADGSLDTSFNPGANSTVRTLALQPDGKVLLGGDFTSVGGTARTRIARLNADGTLDTSFNPGTGANSAVYALALQPDGKVLLGGIFSIVGGTARTRIARLNANGSLDTSFDPGTGANGTVHALALQPDGKVLLGGAFWAINGTARSRIARLEAGAA